MSMRSIAASAQRFAFMCLLVLVALLIASPAPVAAQWQQQPTGGNTRCGRGEPYSVFWRAGTNDRVTVFFEGGGACWDAVSCLLPIWFPVVTLVELDLKLAVLATGEQRSAVVNDTILYLPYCTGDLHIGQKFSDYAIAHYGRINVDAGLDFLQQKILPNIFPDGKQPSQVNVMGCSAGSLGAMLNAPYIFKRFPDAVHRLWAESEFGILTPAQWTGVWKNWNIQLAPWIPALAPQFTQPFATDIMAYIVSQTALFYPKSTWGLYTTNYDTFQTAFYVAGGGFQNWTALMRQMVKEIHGNTTNVATYIGPGNSHCGVLDPHGLANWFWVVSSNGVLLYQWVNDIVNGAPTLQAAVDCLPNC